MSSSPETPCISWSLTFWIANWKIKDSAPNNSKHSPTSAVRIYGRCKWRRIAPPSGNLYWRCCSYSIERWVHGRKLGSRIGVKSVSEVWKRGKVAVTQPVLQIHTHHTHTQYTHVHSTHTYTVHTHIHTPHTHSTHTVHTHIHTHTHTHTHTFPQPSLLICPFLTQ